MKIYPDFVCISIDHEIIDIARHHARRRTEHIIRQFVPQNAPLSALESNYIGALGECCVRFYLTGQKQLGDNYESHRVDSGDIQINGLVYDIKTEAIPLRAFKKLFCGSIKPYQAYGCRVWTARHHQHLKKYTGGVIFSAVPIPDNCRTYRKQGVLRDVLIETAVHLLIVGYAEPLKFTNRQSTWFSPPHPITGRSYKYNSPNFIFHHTELGKIRELKDIP